MSPLLPGPELQSPPLKMSQSAQGGISVAIIGAAGFLGARLATALLADGYLHEVPDSSARENSDGSLLAPISRLVLFDAIEPKIPHNPLGIEVVALKGDVADALQLKDALPPGTRAVFHLAAVVSGQAEKEYDTGFRVNVRGTEAVAGILRSNAEAGDVPARIVFTSSVASFSVTAEELYGPNDGFLSDSSAQRPLNSYGAQKAMMELLLSDLSRRGMVDAVCLRLPTISIRPGFPNAAASGFLSGILREPLLGLSANCPVPENELNSTRAWLASPGAAIEWLRWSSVVDTSSAAAKSRWGASCSVTPPGISVSVQDMLDALDAVRPGATNLVKFEKDDAALSIVKAWPPGFFTERAKELGYFEAPQMVDAVREFVEIGLEETRRIRGL